MMASRKTSPAAMAAHFGFRRMPFVGTGLECYFSNAGYEDAYGRLYEDIHQYQDLLVLLGEKGIGKTLLLRKLMHEAPDEVKFLRCYSNSLNFEEVLNFICDYLWLPAFEADQSQKITALKHHLENSFSQGEHIVLVIDDAHQMREQVLGNLIFLTQADLKETHSLQILLSGTSALQNVLHKLQSTYSLSLNIDPVYLQRFSKTDTIAYVQRQLNAAGGLSKALFPPAVIEHIANHAQGLPQRINTLCYSALRLAYINDQDVLSADLVDQAVAQLDVDKATQAESASDQGIKAEDNLAATKLPFSAVQVTPEDPLRQDEPPRRQAPPSQAPQSVSSALKDDADRTVALTTLSNKPTPSKAVSPRQYYTPSASNETRIDSHQADRPQPTIALHTLQDAEPDPAALETRLRPALRDIPEDDRTVELRALPEALFTSYKTELGQEAEAAAAAKREGSRRRRGKSLGLAVILGFLTLLGGTIAFLAYQYEDFMDFLTEIISRSPLSSSIRTEPLPIPPLEQESASPPSAQAETSAVANEPSIRGTSPPATKTDSSPPPSPGLENSQPQEETPESVPPPDAESAESAASAAYYKSNGDMLLMLGDIASARLFYEAAAKAGDTASLTAVGSTYDPVVLNRLGLRGFHADPIKAAEWYLRAQEAGAPEADDHLQGLRRWLDSSPTLAESKARRLQRLLDSAIPPSPEADGPEANADDETANSDTLNIASKLVNTQSTDAL